MAPSEVKWPITGLECKEFWDGLSIKREFICVYACIEDLWAGSQSCLFPNPRDFHSDPGNIVMTAELMQHPVMVLCVCFP